MRRKRIYLLIDTVNDDDNDNDKTNDNNRRNSNYPSSLCFMDEIIKELNMFKQVKPICHNIYI